MSNRKFEQNLIQTLLIANTAAIALMTTAIVALGILVSDQTVQIDLTTASVDSLITYQDTTTQSIDSLNNSILARNAIDASTNARIAIMYDHHEVHDGHSFTISDVQSVNTATIQWLITTADTTRYSHMIFEVICTGEMLIVVTEGADRNGTNALTEINRRRVGTPNVALTTIHRAVTGGTTDGAVTIGTRRVGSTGVGSKTVSAGESRGQVEFNLKPNTKYIVTVTTYAAVFVTAHFDWYEHIDAG